MSATIASDESFVDSRYAWLRLGIALLICTIGGIGMWSVVVALPAVQAEFGVDRGAASLPYTLTMIGYATGGVMMGKLADRFGVAATIGWGSLCLAAGYVASGFATSLWQFTIAHGLLIAFLGSASTFGPLMADTSFWFAKRRGLAVAICASGNYIAGTIWPPVVQHFIETIGWRTTHVAIGLLCVATILPLSFLLRRRAPMPAFVRIIVRELFPPQEAATRVGVVLMATIMGMALGGWMAGAIFDLAHSYGPAFLNGIAWNLLNLAIAVFLLRRRSQTAATA